MPQINRGPRQYIGLRVPEPLGNLIEVQWRKLGYSSKNDYLADLLAQAHGLTYSVPAFDKGQRELPLPSVS